MSAVPRWPDAPPDSGVTAALAPTGALRAAINLGNPVLAQAGPDGQPADGVSVRLARDLAGRLGLPLVLLAYAAAGEAFAALAEGAWDIAFLGAEPARADAIAFTRPYVLIEGAYLVRNSSPLRTIDEVDRPGVRIAVGRASAYDLFLTRTLREAQIVRAPTGGASASVELFLAEGLEVAAGVRQPLEAAARAHDGLRVIEGRFQTIQQAIGAPLDRGVAVADMLDRFVERATRSGFVRDALRATGQPETLAAPPG